MEDEETDAKYNVKGFVHFMGNGSCDLFVRDVISVTLYQAENHIVCSGWYGIFDGIESGCGMDVWVGFSREDIFRYLFDSQFRIFLCHFR